MTYNHLEIEKKWQDYWKANNTYRAETGSDKPKFYALDMFPYPSGAGLHVGHPVGYTATDIVSRKSRHTGHEVLHPMGWDAFGLPAENYAIKTGVHPHKSTYANIDNFRRQLQMLGFSYDWEREFATTDEDYFRWTQWIFAEMYKKGLLYQEEKPMNWCPSCKVVCANEEVEAGLHERCGTAVEKKNLRQWMFRITDYADRLIADLDAPTVAVIHGWESSSTANWFPNTADILAQDKSIKCIIPDFPNTNNPVYTEWKSHFESEILPHLGRNSILIGHSLGGGFLQKYLSENTLKIGEIILVAPTVTDCGIGELRNFLHNEKRGQKCYSDDNAVGPSFISSILWEDVVKVKKKNNKKLKFSQIKKIFKKGDKTYIFDGETLINHLNYKPEKERRSRFFWGRTVTAVLDRLYFESETVGYFISKNRVFRVVFSKIEDHYLVKTFYESQKYTRAYKLYLLSKADFDYEKIKNSADNIHIYASTNDKYIANEEIDFLTEKLSAKLVRLENRDHLMEADFPELFGKIQKIVDGNLNWPDQIRAMQKNWIGKSAGVEIDFQITNSEQKITTYTTRVDTIFGVSYLVLSPENPLLENLITTEQKSEVVAYQKACQAKSDLERTELNKDKTGVFTGSYAINPINGKQIPIWVADYVLMSYGTGAVMGVPAHDERDHEFATKFDLEIIEVIDGLENPFQKEGGTIKNSDFLNGLDIQSAIAKATEFLTQKNAAKTKTQYKLRDWIFTRQRYWGEPIPLVFDESGNCHVLDAAEFPVTLPDTPNYEPSADGSSPLAKIDEWVNVSGYFTETGTVRIITDNHAAPAGVEVHRFTRETSTMPNWAGSNWYWLRFMDPQNVEAFLSTGAEDYWGPVDLYVGGAEHAVLHLLYSRFWHKVFYDLDLVSTVEPFKKLVNTGLIMAEDGVKMSKSLGNVVNPDEVIADVGADALRVCLMFMGPFEQTKSWNAGAVGGVRKFLERVWRVFEKHDAHLSEPDFWNTNKSLQPTLHKTIKQVGENIDDFKFNTAISSLMVLTNEFTACDKIPTQILADFAILLEPFAPHLAEEFWNQIGNTDSIAKATWPTFDEKFLVEDQITYAVQVNGKVRADFQIAADADKDTVLAHAKSEPNVSKYLEEGDIKKEIFVPGKIVGFVVK